ncbi:hypothetical protein OK016_18490 [Vibrio chagasii]|nr:hypothetical protein [Vibrio chagasii]
MEWIHVHRCDPETTVLGPAQELPGLILWLGGIKGLDHWRRCWCLRTFRDSANG